MSRHTKKVTIILLCIGMAVLTSIAYCIVCSETFFILPAIQYKVRYIEKYPYCYDSDEQGEINNILSMLELGEPVNHIKSVLISLGAAQSWESNMGYGDIYTYQGYNILIMGYKSKLLSIYAFTDNGNLIYAKGIKPVKKEDVVLPQKYFNMIVRNGIFIETDANFPQFYYISEDGAILLIHKLENGNTIHCIHEIKVNKPNQVTVLYTRDINRNRLH